MPGRQPLCKWNLIRNHISLEELIVKTDRGKKKKTKHLERICKGEENNILLIPGLVPPWWERRELNSHLLRLSPMTFPPKACLLSFVLFTVCGENEKKLGIFFLCYMLLLLLLHIPVRSDLIIRAVLFKTLETAI